MAARRLMVSAGIVLVLCSASFFTSASTSAPTFAQTQKKKHKSAATSASAAGTKPSTSTAGLSPAAKRLQKLTEQLKEKNSNWAYSQLSAIALQKSSSALSTRAALALGYYDYSRGQYGEAQKWLELAKPDPLLADYAFYWVAETDLAQQRNEEALATLRQVRQDYPDSAIADQVVQSIAVAATALNQPAEAVKALEAFPLTLQRPGLLLMRAQAHEKAGQIPEAAADYQTIYMRFAVSEQAREAAMKLDLLRGSAGSQVPQISLDQRFAHAGIFFDAKDWGGARNEYSAIVPQLSGANLERAELRVLESGVALGANPAEMIALKVTDPDVDAERSYTLADYDRSHQAETDMLAAVENAASRAPQSRWAASALFLAGNFYWVRLDRDRASSFYQRVAEQFPNSPDATNAQWRVAWTAVLKRAPEAAEDLQQHLRRFPGSPYTADALYFLGRLAEDAGVPGLARSYYEKLIERFPQNYFEALAVPRVRGLDPGPKQDADVLATIPPVPASQKMGDVIPVAAEKRHERALALQSISFDASAEIELRAAYAATGEPRLLLEAAQAAVDAGHCGAAIVTVRQIYPQLEAHSFTDVPRPVWMAAYAMPFESEIRRWADSAGIDPMLVAGLVRQESAFSPEAHSPANAFGLMQLLPSTARRLAKQANIRYAHARLVEPEYNVRLGTLYVSNLLKQFGNVESVLAAYNAGEDRVMSWTAGQNYREPAEFVESIPFTETRQYVQIVSRNADIYRRLYGTEDESHKPRSRSGN
jgi:soluble lytic murein transglycosylase